MKEKDHFQSANQQLMIITGLLDSQTLMELGIRALQNIDSASLL